MCTIGPHSIVAITSRKYGNWGMRHDDVIKWKHFPRYWPFARGIHRSPVNSPHKGQWRGALIFALICARINGWVDNREAGDLRRYRSHSDIIVMEREALNIVNLFWLSRYDIRWQTIPVNICNCLKWFVRGNRPVIDRFSSQGAIYIKVILCHRIIMSML